MAQPLYQTVMAHVVSRIASGALRPGAMLPSETKLGAEIGVSQGTARKALGELEKRGLLKRVQGSGTFVAVSTPESALFSFFRLRAEDGAVLRPELLSEQLRRRRATDAETAALTGAPVEVLEIERVRALQGRPATHEISVAPAALFPGLAERAPLPNALYVLYQQEYNVVVIRAHESLRARCADATEAGLLGVAQGAPLLTIERQAIDMLDRVVELRRSNVACDGLRYEVTLS